MQHFQPAIGIIALLGLAFLVSENRRAVAWRQVLIGIAVTFTAALIMLKVPGATRAFTAVNATVDAIAAASRAGTAFVFGYVGGGPLPFELVAPGREFVLAVQALPVVLALSGR